MWKFPSICGLLVITSFVVILWSDAEAQRRAYYGGRLNTQQLIRRIEQLERRVTVLERAQPAGQQPEEILMSLEKAEQHLAAARTRRTFSQKLHSKGYISAAEMEADKFEVARAEKMLEFARSAQDGQPTEEITSEIEILEAEHSLAFARRQLRNVEGHAAKGLVGNDLAAYRQAVEEAQQRLDEKRARP